MAMTNAQKNVISDIQSVAGQFVLAQMRTTALALMYQNENLAALTDADFQEVLPFAHITQTEFAAAVAAIAAVNTSLNAGTPSNWSKMLKIVETMPK